MSKSRVLLNIIQAFAAVVLGNVAYFLLARSLPLPHHRPFQMDIGLFVDFWFCAVAYGLIPPANGNSSKVSQFQSFKVYETLKPQNLETFAHRLL